MEKINAWNPERLLAQNGSDTIEFDSMTTGNFGGFDVWLKEGQDAELDVSCNHGQLQSSVAEIGMDDIVLDAGGLKRELRAFRLPDENPHKELHSSHTIDIKPDKDNPIWICVTTEDGFQAWSSPIFVFK